MSRLDASPKAALRRTLLRARQRLPKEVWQQQSYQLCQHLQNSRVFAQARTVLAYVSVRQEPDLTPLTVADAGQHVWGLPRCQGTSLVWHACSPQDPAALSSGAYGIPEPRPDLPQLIVDQVDLILVPAIACDARGYRLGYGGGFYDRLLSSPGWQLKPTVGVVFEFARLTTLPVEPWDQPLQAVCTEAGLFGSIL